MKAVNKINPLLHQTNLLKFDRIEARHFPEAIKYYIKEANLVNKKLLEQKKYTWNDFIAPFEAAGEKIARTFSLLSHLKSVNSTHSIRNVYQQILPLITDHTTKITQNKKIYDAICQVASGAECSRLDSVQQKIINDYLLDFKLSGISLSPKDKRRFLLLKQKIFEASHRFSCNVMDATENCEVKVVNNKDTLGIPKSILAVGRDNAKKRQFSGWLFKLDFPTYYSLISNADSRKVRKEVYLKYNLRASKEDEKFNNDNLIMEILELRLKMSYLLSFGNYAEYTLATKMVKHSKEVLDFLHMLGKKVKPIAEREFEKLKDFAQKHGIKKLAPWDISYYTEKMVKGRIGLSQDELKLYFPLEHVLEQIFKIAARLYGISIEEHLDESAVYGKIRLFDIFDSSYNLMGRFYLDPYCRENKQSGAWVSEYSNRYRLENGCLMLPIAFLVTNFLPPEDGKITLITHDDLLTLLHEFGHLLQHILTKIEYLGASGINGVPWDAVEIVSQLMENWGWQSNSLRELSRHYQTAKQLSKGLLAKLANSRKFFSATKILRQIELSLIDLEIHLETENLTITKLNSIVKRIQQSYRLIPTCKNISMLNTFSHIFSGSYAAGYYSYQWAGVLSADIFSKFKKYGLFSYKIGKLFLDRMLAMGGSEDPMVLFKRFMGREPRLEALLEQEGFL